MEAESKVNSIEGLDNNINGQVTTSRRRSRGLCLDTVRSISLSVELETRLPLGSLGLGLDCGQYYCDFFLSACAV